MVTLVFMTEVITIAAFAWCMLPLLVDCSLQAFVCLGCALLALALHVW